MSTNDELEDINTVDVRPIKMNLREQAKSLPSPIAGGTPPRNPPASPDTNSPAQTGPGAASPPAASGDSPAAPAKGKKTTIEKCPKCKCALAGGVCPNCGSDAGAEKGASTQPTTSTVPTASPSAPAPAVSDDPRTPEDIAEEYAQIDVRELKKALKDGRVGAGRKKAWVSKALEQAAIAFIDDADESQIRGAAKAYKLFQLQNQ